MIELQDGESAKVTNESGVTKIKAESEIEPPPGEHGVQVLENGEEVLALARAIDFRGPRVSVGRDGDAARVTVLGDTSQPGESLKHDPKRYGAVGDGSSDDTEAVQAAINAAAGGVVDFSGGAYKVGELWIEKPMHILGHGSTMVGANNGIFGVRAEIPYLTIDGFSGFVFPDAPVGASSRDAIGNHDRFAKNDTDGFGYSDHFDYRVDTFRITNNVFDGCKVCVVEAALGTWIANNKWIHSRTAARMAPYWLVVENEGLADKYGSAHILHNDFRVHPQKGFNQDIIKLAGGLNDALLEGNYVENLDPESLAQVDVFTGGHKARIIGNSLVNVQIHRKRYGPRPGGGFGTFLQWDQIVANNFEMRHGTLFHPALYYIGHMSLINSNIFIVANPNEAVHCIWFDDSNDGTDLGLGSDTANGLNVIGNFADMRGAANGSRFVNVDPSQNGKKSRGLVFANNQLWGGSGLINSPDWSDDVQIGNVWVR